MTAPLIFPVLPGQGWSVRKKPIFATLLADHASGREVRAPRYANPIWSFELSFNGLDGSPSGVYGGLGAQSLQRLMGLFLQCQGQFGTFVYYDPTDYAVTGQTFGTGDGATTAFQLTRSLGGFSEAIIAPVTSSTTIYFPGGASVFAATPVIAVGGSTVASSSYALANGLVSFTSAPANGAALTWTGCFGFLCRFEDDNLDFEQFMQNLWRLDSLKFRSVRPQ